jgi:hypothetical protein
MYIRYRLDKFGCDRPIMQGLYRNSNVTLPVALCYISDNTYISLKRRKGQKGLAHTSALNRRVFFTASMKRFVSNLIERAGGSFIAAFFQTQHASLSGRCGGRSAIGGGNATRKNLPSCAHER